MKVPGPQVHALCPGRMLVRVHTAAHSSPSRHQARAMQAMAEHATSVHDDAWRRGGEHLTSLSKAIPSSHTHSRYCCCWCWGRPRCCWRSAAGYWLHALVPNGSGAGAAWAGRGRSGWPRHLPGRSGCAVPALLLLLARQGAAAAAHARTGC